AFQPERDSAGSQVAMGPADLQSFALLKDMQISRGAITKQFSYVVRGTHPALRQSRLSLTTDYWQLTTVHDR
ncbi:MAG: hypothetical protein ACHQ2F_15245, partial [Desulfobaccales bacterium]